MESTIFSFCNVYNRLFKIIICLFILTDPAFRIESVMLSRELLAGLGFNFIFIKQNIVPLKCSFSVCFDLCRGLELLNPNGGTRAA